MRLPELGGCRSPNTKGVAAPIVVAMFLAGCGYHAGSFSHDRVVFAGERATTGCIDVSVAPHEDIDTDGPTLVYALGNRCDAAVRVNLDLPARIVSPDYSASVWPYDPRREIRSLLLDGRNTAQEFIEYTCPATTRAQRTELCVDVSKIDADGGSSDPVIVCVPAECPPRVGSTRAALRR